MRIPPRRIFARLLLLVAAAFALPPAMAQAFPSRPIRLVVPFPAGGGTDTIARTLAEGLARELGQSVIVDNKPGAGTVIGNDAVAKSAPDGHVLLLNTSAIAIVPSIHPKLPYPADAFTPVLLLGRAPSVAVVRTDSPLQSAADFLAQARARPGKLSYGSAGNGTSTHLAAELLKARTGVFVTHVPYRGASPLVTDVLGGQIDVAFGTLPSMAPFIASGKLRALAVTSGTRSPLLAGVPTFAEAGVPGYEAEVWFGIFAPAATPAPIVQRLSLALQKAAAGDAFARRAAAEGLALTLEGPEDAMRVVRADEEKWRKVVKDQGIRVD